MTLDLNGLIPATVLPMDADGRIDEPALRGYIALGGRAGARSRSRSTLTPARART